MSMLSIKNLSIRFGGVKALTDINLDVSPKSFVGLMGPNGAGKTTLVNCISRLHNPSEGQIHFDGQNILKLRGDELVRLGIARTFQDLTFFNKIETTLVIDYMKLGQFNPVKNSLLGSGFQTKKSVAEEKEITKNARRILDFFRQLRDHLEEPQERERNYPILHGGEGFPDLLDFEYHPIGFLSFAWRRRLDLARALACNPRLLLLDEPAQGLAPSEIDNLGKVLKLIQSEFGVAALIVEHNVDTLMKISDHIAVLDHGKMVAQGAPEKIRANQEVIDIYLGTKQEKATDINTSITTIKASTAPKEKSEPLIEVKNLDLFYGSAQALFSVSLKFYPQQITAILGTNGSGKSTLLKAISGFEKPKFGEILFKGEPLPLDWPEDINERGIQYVPQGHVIFSELTVMDNLRIGAYALEKKGGKLSDGLEKIYSYFPDLKNFRKAQAASLSGGQQQMLAIAQALIGNPLLLLLDEPSLGLSPILVETLFEVIQKISKEEKCSIVMVEQNTAKALEISDYIFLMSSGVLIGEGTSQQLRENSSVLKELLGFR